MRRQRSSARCRTKVYHHSVIAIPRDKIKCSLGIWRRIVPTFELAVSPTTIPTSLSNYLSLLPTTSRVKRPKDRHALLNSLEISSIEVSTKYHLHFLCASHKYLSMSFQNHGQDQNHLLVRSCLWFSEYQICCDWLEATCLISYNRRLSGSGKYTAALRYAVGHWQWRPFSKLETTSHFSYYLLTSLHLRPMTTHTT